MLLLLVIVLCILLLLVISEFLWRHADVDPEYTRKFVHITVGSFVAFWPYFLSKREILGLSGAFVLVVLVSTGLGIFKAMHSVQRPTWGEVFFALAVGAVAYVARDNRIYLVALLHMGLADGLAAVVGTKFGKRSRYHVFRHAKSIVGTVTFFVVSMLLLSGYALLTSDDFNVWIVGIALAVTVLENVAVRGLDNILVPVLVAVSLNVLR